MTTNNVFNTHTTQFILQTKAKWKEEQLEMKAKLTLEDKHNWSLHRNEADLHYIGGVDISFVKGSETIACAALVVLSYPKLEIVYKNCKMVQMTEPYIAGFLAFREVDFFVDLINELRSTNVELEPQLIMVDGNGILHYHGFGVACHLGLLANIPTVGVAKNLLQVDGLSRGDSYTNKVDNLKENGDSFDLVGDSGICHGLALKNTAGSTKPIYISPGHMVSMATSKWVVMLCSRFRIPEPTRHADIISREQLRQEYPPTPKHRKMKNKAKK